MAGISGGRYKDFLLQEIMVLGLERRWSAVDTCQAQMSSQQQRRVEAVGPKAHLVDAEVGHPEDHGAGHELRLGTLRERAEARRGGRVDFPFGRNDDTKMRRAPPKGSDRGESAEPHGGMLSPHTTHRGTWLKAPTALGWRLRVWAPFYQGSVCLTKPNWPIHIVPNGHWGQKTQRVCARAR